MFQSYADEKLSRMAIRFTSKDARAVTRFVPMEPAPPVIRMVLRRKVSDKSSKSGPQFVPVFHPLHGPVDAFLRGHRRVVLQILDCLGTIHRFCFRRERLCLFVGDEGIVAPYRLEDEVRVSLDVSLPFRATC